jgi:hypothetical protein
MNSKLKKSILIGKGLSKQTLSKLNESEIDAIYSTIVEQVTQTTKQVKTTKIPSSTARTTGGVVDGISIKQDAAGNIIATQTEQELDEELDDEDALGALSMQTATGQELPHDASDEAPDGMDDDSDYDRKMVGMAESKKTKKPNPYAICTSTLGKEFGTTKRSEWTKSQMKKYERCKADIDESLKESKKPVSLLENEIFRIVEKHLPPKITKKDLMNYLSESPAVAPAKPQTKPDVKPGIKPGTKPRPSHPGKNPFPGEHPAPKASRPSPEQAKKEVINVILDLIKSN